MVRSHGGGTVATRWDNEANRTMGRCGRWQVAGDVARGGHGGVTVAHRVSHQMLISKELFFEFSY